MESDRVGVRAVLEAWAAAVRAADVDVVLATHTDDVVLFDVPPPFEAVGTGGEGFDVRLTVGLRKVEERWLISHEHHSVPAEEDPAAAAPAPRA